ncbi:MAG: hypothetical protein ACYCPT_13950 [Acidimicrobiales bacterium]
MMDSLFDVEPPTIAAVTNSAIKRAEIHADGDWLAKAMESVRFCARMKPTFTTDDVWARLEFQRVEGTHEPRAMGAVMRHAKAEKIVMPTGEYRVSERIECHGRPVAVWRSMPHVVE